MTISFANKCVKLIHNKLNMSVEGGRKRGRPKKPFDELSEVSKRHNAKKMRENLSTDEIGYTLEKCFKARGFLDASKVVKSLILNPAIGTEYLKSCENQKLLKEYTPDEAVALTMDMKLTKRQYDTMRFGSKKRNCRLYPTYSNIFDAKNQCYPPNEFVRVSEMGFKIDLQAILDLTTKRLVETFPSQFLQQVQKLRLISKWGFDGASAQSSYKQKFQDPNADDSSIFLTTLVPIVLRDEENPEIVHWQNLKPSSTTNCRPIRLEFQKENRLFTLRVNSEIHEEIDSLQPTIINNDNCCVEVTHELYCTMIDGKICNYLSNNNSSQNCFICKASPKQMNKLHLIYDRPKNVEFYKFGLSTLHAWIRLMENVLHVSYNMSFKKWRVDKKEHKAARKRRKREIQAEFRLKMGLKVDYVLQGKGTTNDGNTARKFFRNYHTTAKITGFDVRLLKRFAVILQTMASGKQINVNAFDSYAKKTAVLYVELYPWYYMAATVHKILIHGADVIRFAIVPIGQLSEEVQESRHKEVRRYRECNTRKMSRTKTNEDLMHSLLISSDPLITSKRMIKTAKKLPMLPEAEDLLINTDIESDDE